MSGTYTQQSGALTQQSWHLRPTHSELLFPRAQRNRTLSKRQNAVRIVTTYLFYPCISCFQPQLAAPSQAPADFILFHPFLRRYVKHATLIEKCFPAERLSESTPNSNELSYLVYYAQSKPAKLAKVGAYLAKRAKKDLQRRRRGDVIVGLRIFDELLEECGRDLNFFGKDVLGTLDATLREGDAEVVWAAARTFELFCRCHTGATLAIDTELRAMYTGMARTLVASKTPVGMRAIQAIVESQATYATDSYDELPGISQAILDRLAGSPALAPADDAKVLENQIMDIRKHVDSKPSEEMLGHWAWLCLETLMRRSHGQHSQVIIAEVFKYLDTRLQWQPATFCVSLVGSVIENLYSQDQNMVIVETLAFLTDGTRSSQR
ncbi:plasma membrane localization protein, partial [Linderina macrospora]